MLKTKTKTKPFIVTPTLKKRSFSKCSFSLLRKNKKGMTFIEVLVALVILVTGILGAVAMQASAKKGSFDSMQRSLASALAQDMLARMRNNDVALLDTYEGTAYGNVVVAAPNPTCETVGSLCTPAQLTNHDIYEWVKAIRGENVLNAGSRAGGLIAATGCIDVSNNLVTVVVSWEGREKTSNGFTGNGSFASACDSQSIAGKRKRQVHVESFII
jgi:type IV pilus assembly protein PilV